MIWRLWFFAQLNQCQPLIVTVFFMLTKEVCTTLAIKALGKS